MTEPYNRSVLAQTLDGRLRELHITQAELARRLGTSQQNVSKWIKGETVPRADRIKQIAAALKMDEARLYKLALGVDLGGDQPEDDVQVAALSGKWDRLAERDKRAVLRLIDEMLEEE